MRKSFALLALGVLATSAPSLAEGPLEPPDLGQYLRWGPLRARPGLQLSNLGYDDNIFLDDANKVSDFRATVTPRLDGLVLFGTRAFLEFQERIDLTGYAQNTDQSYIDHRGNGRVTVPFGKFGVFTEYRLDRVHQRPRDQEDLRPLRHDHRLGAGLIFELGWRTDIEIADTFLRLRYDDDDNPEIGLRLDRNEERRSVKVGYRVRGRTRLTLDLETSDIRFVTAETLRDSDGWSAMPGVALDRGGRLSGTLRLGWARIDAQNPLRPDFSEPVGDAELAYSFGHGTRIEITGERVPGFTVVGDQTYYVATGGGVRGIRYLNPWLGIESGVELGRVVFPETGANGTDRVDRLTDVDVGLRLRLAENSLGRRTEYSIRLVRSQRDSTQPNLDRTRTTVSVGAILGF